MSGERSRPAAEARTRDPAALYEASHRVLRFLTGVMIVAFLLIVVLTTISTGPFVQVTARGLYFLILAVPVASLLTWILRLWAERRAAGPR